METQSFPIRSAFLSNKSFNVFLISTIMALLATTLGVVIDSIVVGRLLGPESFAAVNIVAPILQIFNALHLLADQYSSIMIGFAIGRRDKVGAKKIFSTAILLNLFFGVLMVVIGCIFMSNILNATCPNADLQPLVKEYLRIVILSSPVYLLLPGMCFFTRSDGNPNISTIALIVANVINLALDIVFIKYCSMGLQGSALASTIGFVCGILVTCTHFFRKECIIALVKPDFKKYSKDILLKALPFVFTMMIMSISFVFANTIIIKYLGSNGMLIMSVCYNIFSFSLLINMGTNQTMLPLLGILKGLDDRKGYYFTLKRAFRTVIVLTFSYMIVILLFTRTIVGWYGIDVSGDMIKSIHIYVIGLIGFAVDFFFLAIFLVTNRARLMWYFILLKDIAPILVMLLFCNSGHAENLWWSYVIGTGLVFAVFYVISIFIRMRNRNLAPLFLIEKPEDDTFNHFDFSISADLNNMRAALTAIRNQISRHPEVTTRQSFVIDLCCEEIISNIIEHGYKRHPERHTIDVFISIQSDSVTACVRDDGMPFNPIKYQNDTTIGLLLISKLCQSVDYIYSMNQNIMTIVAKKER